MLARPSAHALCTRDEKRIPSYNNAHTPYVYKIKPFDLLYDLDTGLWMLGTVDERNDRAWRRAGKFESTIRNLRTLVLRHTIDTRNTFN